MTVGGWFFGAIVLLICIGLTGIQWLNALLFFVLIALYWLSLKWFVANIASNGQPLGLSFSCTYWAYLGWTVLSFLSVFPIICSPCLSPAYPRSVSRNIQRTP